MWSRVISACGLNLVLQSVVLVGVLALAPASGKAVVPDAMEVRAAMAVITFLLSASAVPSCVSPHLWHNRIYAG